MLFNEEQDDKDRKINEFKNSIRNGQHSKIEMRLKKMRNLQKKEIYIRRTYREKNTGRQTKLMEQLFLKEKITLLHGEAGAGAAMGRGKYHEEHFLLSFSCSWQRRVRPTE